MLSPQYKDLFCCAPSLSKQAYSHLPWASFPAAVHFNILAITLDTIEHEGVTSLFNIVRQVLFLDDKPSGPALWDTFYFFRPQCLK